MLNPGTVLGNRYEIITKIGTGGMADVYKGRDLKLNRFVAVKVLKSEFSSNKNFVSKFKVEAQSAAGLMHHNIVNVYDVGEESGLYYFVMELVEGITLKNYIEKKIRLSYKEALSIAIQVSQGIEAAHNNGIIHRDIKPQNIIISREGKVKVADFGIARAATSDTITSHAMGSVHYTSPEQARGGYSDAKSDIYSIGITLFEMVTGRVPFDGETTVAIAIKHIQEDMPSPKVYVPDLPISVEKIILKCTQKNPDRRYYNMAELIKDLKKACVSPDEDFVVIQDARSNAGTKVMTEEDRVKVNNYQANYVPNQQIKPNPIQQSQVSQNSAPIYVHKGAYDDVDPYEDGRFSEIPNSRPQQYYGNQFDDDFDEEDLGEDFERDEYIRRQQEVEREKARRLERERQIKEQSRAKKNAQKNAKKNSQKSDRQRYEQRERQNANRSSSKARNARVDDLDDDVDPKMEKIMTSLMIVAAIIIAFVAIFAVSKVIGAFGKSPSTKVEEGYAVVPNVVGLDINSASKELEEAGLTAKATYQESAQYDKDFICSQDIEPGTKVTEGTALTLVISSGKVATGSSVPDVVGKSEAEARVLLENEGFVMAVEYVTSDTVEKGNVVSQSPLGATSAVRGSEVKVMISEGKEFADTLVPDLVGQDKETAINLLTQSRLLFNTVNEENNDAVEAGHVISQSIAAGTTVEEGTIVDFTISKGASGYTCSYAIAAPADYLEGTEAIIVLLDPAGNQLESVSTSQFPYSLVKTGIVGSNAGVLTVTYQKTDGSWDTTAPAAVSFTQE